MKSFIRCLALLLITLPILAQTPVAKPPSPSSQPYAKPRVQILTNYGAMVVELEPEAAPKTVANFLAYVKKGHYSGTIFHRVIPGFMIQGGGLSEDMAEKKNDAPIKNEAPLSFRAGLKNLKGTVAMARTAEPNSATSQFFVNTADNPALDFKDETEAGIGYCVFGKVIEGMEVPEKIEKAHTVWKNGQANVPEYAVKIKSVEILGAK